MSWMPEYASVPARLSTSKPMGRWMTEAFRRGSVGNILGLFRTCLLRADAVRSWQPLFKLSEQVLAAPMRELVLAPENQLVNLRLKWLAARGALLCRQD